METVVSLEVIIEIMGGNCPAKREPTERTELELRGGKREGTSRGERGGEWGRSKGNGGTSRGRDSASGEHPQSQQEERRPQEKVMVCTVIEKCSLWSGLLLQMIFKAAMCRKPSFTPHVTANGQDAISVIQFGKGGTMVENKGLGIKPELVAHAPHSHSLTL